MTGMAKRNVLHREMDRIKESFLLLGGRVESAMDQAIRSLFDKDVGLARQVIEGDEEIDQLEVDFEEDCLKVLALYQPLAVDLRFIVAVLKINNDLERVGDLAASIAEHTLFLAGHKPIIIPFDYETMAERTRWMLRTSLDSLVNMSATMAASVRAEDDKVDEINRQMYRQVAQEIRNSPDRIEALINVIGLSRCFERTADLATNIAEDVIYLVEGDIVRHEAYRVPIPNPEK